MISYVRELILGENLAFGVCFDMSYLIWKMSKTFSKILRVQILKMDSKIDSENVFFEKISGLKC